MAIPFDCFLIHRELKYGSVESLRPLLINFDVNCQTKCWYTLLVEAITNLRVDMVKVLLEEGADPSQSSFGVTPLIQACKYGSLPIVELLLPHLSFDQLDAFDSKGRTALCHAAIKGSRDIVSLLINQGATVAVRNFQHRNLLHYAAKGNLETFQWLLNARIGDLEQKDYKGRTPYQIAHRYYRDSIVDFLDGH